MGSLWDGLTLFLEQARMPAAKTPLRRLLFKRPLPPRRGDCSEISTEEVRWFSVVEVRSHTSERQKYLPKIGSEWDHLSGT